MEFQLYNSIVNCLKGLYLEGFKKKDRDKVENIARSFYLEDGLLWYQKNSSDKPRFVIKQDESMKTILNDGHSGPGGGHFAKEATRRNIEEKFYWPRMGRDIDGHVETCETCQRRGKPKKINPLRTIEVSRVFELIGMDLIGPLPPTSQGNRYIIVMTEYLTKWVEAKAIPNKKAETIAEFLYNDVIARFGTPERMLTDQGTEFLNETVTALQKVMGIKGIHSSAYHPQTNGQTERMNKTLCETLAKLVLDNKGEWDRWIGSALYAYRNKDHSVTKFSPSFLLYGFKLKTPVELNVIPEKQKSPITVNDHMNLIGKRLKDVRELAKGNTKKAHERQQKYYDKHVKQKQFKIGDKVLLYDSATQHTHGDKFRDIYKEGIFVVHEVLNNGTYKLRDEKDRVTKITTGDRLKEFHSRPAWEPIIRIENNTLGPQPSRIPVPIETQRLRITSRTQKEDEIRKQNEVNKPKGKMLPVTGIITDDNENDINVQRRAERIRRLQNSGLLKGDIRVQDEEVNNINLYKGPMKGRPGETFSKRSQSPTKKTRK